MKEFTFQTKDGIKISGKYIEFPQKIEKKQAKAFDILLIHAFPFDSDMYINNFDEENFVQALNYISLANGKIRIFLPDLPGFGRSEIFKSKPKDLSPYVEAVNEVVKYFQIKKLILGGCSMGGYIALEYIRKHPNVVEGLVLIDTRPDADNKEQKQNRLDTIKSIDKSLELYPENERSTVNMKKLYVRDNNIKSFIETLYSRVISSNTRKENPKLSKQILDLMKRQRALGIIHALNGMVGRNDTSIVLKDFNKNTLIIVGENDIITPKETAELMKNLLSKATFEIIPFAGHLSNLENSFDFNQRLLKYLQIKI